MSQEHQIFTNYLIDWLFISKIANFHYHQRIILNFVSLTSSVEKSCKESTKQLLSSFWPPQLLALWGGLSNWVKFRKLTNFTLKRETQNRTKKQKKIKKEKKNKIMYIPVQWERMQDLNPQYRKQKKNKQEQEQEQEQGKWKQTKN